jgi:hypothetical protein
MSVMRGRKRSLRPCKDSAFLASSAHAASLGGAESYILYQSTVEICSVAKRGSVRAAYHQRDGFRGRCHGELRPSEFDAEVGDRHSNQCHGFGRQLGDR